MSGASQTRVTRAAQASRALDTKPSTINLVAGPCERGPIGYCNSQPALPLTSWTDYQAIYGGFTANVQDVPLQVKALFDEAGENGGAQVWVSRVVHCTDPTDPTTRTSAAAVLALLTANVAATAGVSTGGVGPYVLAPNQHVDVLVNGAGAVVATFTATQASRTSTTGPYVLVNGFTLIFAIDGGGTFTKTFTTAEFLAIGAATPAEVVASLNAFFAGNGIGAVATVSANAVKITSNRFGTGSGVNVSGGTANAVLTFTTGNLPGTGNVSNIVAVTVAEVISIVNAAIAGLTTSNVGGRAVFTSNTLGGSSSIQVSSATTATGLGFDNAPHQGLATGTVTTLLATGKTDGTYANALTIVVLAGSSGLATDMNLQVLRGGVIAEQWRNGNLDPTSANYIVTLVNLGGLGQAPSNLIALTDEFPNIPAPSNMPALGTFGPMAGGLDGLAGLADADWAGGVSANGRTGMRCFDLIKLVSILLTPGRATAAVANAQVNYCETVRGGMCFAIPECPPGMTIAQAINYFANVCGLVQLSEMSAAYYPRVKHDNPSTAVFGNVANVITGVGGALAGLCAKIDQSKVGGAFEHPASQEIGSLSTVRGLESEEVKDLAHRGLLFDSLINPIMVDDGVPAWVDGARTLKSTGPFPTVGESRGVLTVQQQITIALDPKRNRNIRKSLLQSMATAIITYLRALTDADCFASRTYSEAFSFDNGKALNNAASAKRHETNELIGLATSAPNEFNNVIIAPLAPTS